jgi:hypothetical protein
MAARLGDILHDAFCQELENGKTPLGRCQQAASEQVDGRVLNNIASMSADPHLLSSLCIETDAALQGEMTADLYDCYSECRNNSAKLFNLVVQGLSQRCWSLTYWQDSLPHAYAVGLHHIDHIAKEGAQGDGHVLKPGSFRKSQVGLPHSLTRGSCQAWGHVPTQGMDAVKKFWHAIVKAVEVQRKSKSVLLTRLLQDISLHNSHLNLELAAEADKCSWNPHDQNFNELLVRLFSGLRETKTPLENVFHGIKHTGNCTNRFVFKGGGAMSLS